MAMKQNQRVSDKLKVNNFIESKPTQPILYSVPLQEAKTHKMLTDIPAPSTSFMFKITNILNYKWSLHVESQAKR